MKVENRGLSPLVASVFLIVLALIISSLVFSWSYGFIESKENANDFSIDELCDSVEVSVVVVSNSSGRYYLEIINRGNIDINSFKFKTYSGGNSKVVDLNVSVLVGGAITGSVVLGVALDGAEALPVLDGKLIGESSEIICEKNPIYLDGF